MNSDFSKWNTACDKMLKTALEMRSKAYAPYSGFTVGAALLTKDDVIFGGCNVENASFSLTNCAERTAFFNAVSNGCKNFKAILIVGNTAEKTNVEYTYPCGSCRQVMREFCDDDFLVIVVKTDINGNVEQYDIKPLSALLPNTFTLTPPLTK